MTHALDDQFPFPAEVILDSIADGVFTINDKWKITYFNRAAERITGVPAEEALGKQCCDVFRASVCERGCLLKYSMETGSPVVNKAVYIINAQGERVPISISTALLSDAGGKPAGGVEIFRDLSLIEELNREIAEKYTLDQVISKSHAMQELFTIVPQLADSDSTVLIEGESGTGKELFARAIHNIGPRKDKPFVAVNCGALPDTLLESELFGYVAGAFTNAVKDKPGRFALAGGGTIFLDEIGDVSEALQVRLLRVLQEKICEPLGSVESVPVEARVIAATNKSLSDLVEKGRFRADLYYRVNVVRLEIPPLRQRKEDIPLLIEYFIGRFNRREGKDITSVSEDALEALLVYEYPGNVRELENIIERAFVLCTSGLIRKEHLPPHLRSADETRPEEVVSTGAVTLKELEKMAITAAIKRHNGNKAAAARQLGIHKTTLFRKLKSMKGEEAEDPVS